MINFEAAGDLEDWPPNVPGKPTHLVVLGTHHEKRGKVCEILFTATYPDLDKAKYWGAKKEMDAIRRLGFSMASRVLWQHDISVEEAVATIYKKMEPEADKFLKAVKAGKDPAKAMEGNTLMKPIDYSKPRDYLVEIEIPGDPDLN